MKKGKKNTSDQTEKQLEEAFQILQNIGPTDNYVAKVLKSRTYIILALLFSHKNKETLAVRNFELSLTTLEPREQPFAFIENVLAYIYYLQTFDCKYSTRIIELCSDSLRVLPIRSGIGKDFTLRNTALKTHSLSSRFFRLEDKVRPGFVNQSDQRFLQSLLLLQSNENRGVAKMGTSTSITKQLIRNFENRFYQIVFNVCWGHALRENVDYDMLKDMEKSRQECVDANQCFERAEAHAKEMRRIMPIYTMHGPYKLEYIRDNNMHMMRMRLNLLRELKQYPEALVLTKQLNKMVTLFETEHPNSQLNQQKNKVTVLTFSAVLRLKLPNPNLELIWEKLQQAVKIPFLHQDRSFLEFYINILAVLARKFTIENRHPEANIVYCEVCRVYPLESTPISKIDILCDQMIRSFYNEIVAIFNTSYKLITKQNELPKLECNIILERCNKIELNIEHLNKIKMFATSSKHEIIESNVLLSKIVRHLLFCYASFFTYKPNYVSIFKSIDEAMEMCLAKVNEISNHEKALLLSCVNRKLNYLLMQETNVEAISSSLNQYFLCIKKFPKIAKISGITSVSVLKVINLHYEILLKSQLPKEALQPLLKKALQQLLKLVSIYPDKKGIKKTAELFVRLWFDKLSISKPEFNNELCRYAVVFGATDVLTKILDLESVDINHTAPSSGRSLLHFAILSPILNRYTGFGLQKEVVKMLIDKKIDLSLQDGKEKKATDYLQKRSALLKFIEKYTVENTKNTKLEF